MAVKMKIINTNQTVMRPLKEENFKYIDYSEFWQNSLQKIEEIEQKLNRTIYELEKKYFGFDDIYEKAEEEINTLLSIYSSFNCFEGIEYIFRLSSLIKNYKNRYTHNGIDFKLIHFLLSKISDLRDRSLENFPHIVHTEKNGPIAQVIAGNNADPEDPQYHKRPYKWLTFMRNGSWFIVPFQNIKILNDSDVEFISFEKPDTVIIRYNDKLFTAKDFFADINRGYKNPTRYLLIDSGKKVFAADKTGKKIFARNDFLKEKIIPFKELKNNLISPGHIKIFGKNHILVKNPA